MLQEFMQNSLFPLETDFNPEHFKESVLDSKFECCLRAGVISGFEKTQAKFRDGNNSMSVMSHCLHEDIYNAIQEELSQQLPSEHFVFSPNVYGNERLYFTYKDYIFIIKLADSTNNSTKQEIKIRNQALDHHVVSIVYTLTAFRDGISTLRLQYIKGQTIVWQHSIHVEYTVDMTDHNLDEVTIVPQKPKLRTTNKDKEAI
jgi:hypothetical protein